jgi:hypothetical protein
MQVEKTRTYLDIYFIELIRTIRLDVKVYVERINPKLSFLVDQASIDIFNEIVKEFFNDSQYLSFSIREFRTVEKVIDALERRHINITNRIVDQDVDKSISKKIKDYFSSHTLKTQKQTSVFEKIAFAENRPDVPEEYQEDNTRLENEVFYALDKHVNDNQKIKQEHADVIKNILRKNKYADMFVKPSTAYVYRGMHIKEELADKIRDKSNFVFLPKAGASSSWTSSESIANNFSQFNGYVGLVLKASTKVNDSRFLDLVNIYAIRKLSVYRDEKEIIGLGPIDVESLSVIEHKFVR